ncbi:MAG TPA: hypothetical protein VGB53_00870 [Rubricoccaceae bacterium]|jgi:hypothetical protein
MKLNLSPDPATRFRQMAEYFGVDEYAKQYALRVGIPFDDAVRQIREMMKDGRYPSEREMSFLEWRCQNEEGAVEFVADRQWVEATLASLASDGIRLRVDAWRYRGAAPPDSIILVPEPPGLDPLDERLIQLGAWLHRLGHVDTYSLWYHNLGFDVYVDRMVAGHVFLRAVDRREGEMQPAKMLGVWLNNMETDHDEWVRLSKELEAEAGE